MNTTRATAEEIQNGLNQFFGTTQYHQISILSPSIVMTDGVAWLCEQAQCYWLVEAIASHQPHCMKDSMLRNMQFWTLKVNNDNTAVLICERDTNNKAFEQKIHFTDFPIPEIKLWVERGEYLVILLPQEH